MDEQGGAAPSMEGGSSSIPSQASLTSGLPSHKTRPTLPSPSPPRQVSCRRPGAWHLAGKVVRSQGLSQLRGDFHWIQLSCTGEERRA